MLQMRADLANYSLLVEKANTTRLLCTAPAYLKLNSTPPYQEPVFE